MYVIHILVLHYTVYTTYTYLYFTNVNVVNSKFRPFLVIYFFGVSNGHDKRATAVVNALINRLLLSLARTRGYIVCIQQYGK